MPQQTGAHWTPAYVGLGSNLADPGAQVRTALAELAALRDSRLVSHSGLYRSPPMGPPDQPDYVNAVAGLLTRLPVQALMEALLELENRHGRDRSVGPWQARTLDLDLLVYAELTLQSDTLTVPHPGLAERAFVVLPLAEIAPSLVVPGLGRVAALAAACDASTLEVLG